MSKPSCKFHCLGLGLAVTFYPVNTQGQGFDLHTTPAAQWATAGETIEFGITIVPNGGFNAQVFLDLAYTDLPAGFSTEFTTSPVSFPYTQPAILTLHLNEIVPQQVEHRIVIRGQNGPVQDLDTVYLSLEGRFCSWEQRSQANIEYLGLFIDGDDGKWLYNSYGGIALFQDQVLSSYTTSNSQLPSNQVRDLTQDPGTGAIWMATSAGLASFDGTFWTVINSSNSNLPCDNLNSVRVDSQGNIWVGTGYCGASLPGTLYRYNGITFTEYALPGPTSILSVPVMEIDAMDRIWVVSSLPSGLNNLDRYDGDVAQRIGGEGTCFALEKVKDIAFDNEGALWIAASGAENWTPHIRAGLIRFDGSSWETWNRVDLVPYNHRKVDLDCNTLIQDNNSALPQETISSIAVSEGGTVWFCAHSDENNLSPNVARWDGTTLQVWDETNSPFNGDGRTYVDLDDAENVWVFYSYHKILYSRGCDYFAPVPDAEPFSDLRISPNPCHDRLSLELPDNVFEHLTIFDTQGRRLSRAIVDQRERMDIDITGLSAGLYRVVLSDGKRALMATFIKQ
ncbi:MAG: T9SS type A sorting domain-containing protein [Flavobacteriales bacterium]|nr:T9SS type A sorting domain-containing protein [Flavobacteriales bacterium]